MPASDRVKVVAPIMAEGASTGQFTIENDTPTASASRLVATESIMRVLNGSGITMQDSSPRRESNIILKPTAASIANAAHFENELTSP